MSSFPKYLISSVFCRWGLVHLLCERGTRSYLDAPKRDSAVDCLVHAVVPYYLVLCVSEGKSTNIFPNGQIIYAINVPRSK